MPSKCWCEMEDPRLTEALTSVAGPPRTHELRCAVTEEEGPQMTLMASSQKWHV